MDQEKDQVSISNLCGGAAVAAIAAWLKPKFGDVPVIS
jgi:uncharacterized membrane protein YadS